jgi:2-polyprenyl-3-methyl-5-hydroxy-6-metoxy-1,4-benzoquinol methylase
MKSDTHTPARGLETMSAALPKAEGYHRWVLSKAKPFLGNRVLEVGGGSGIYTRLLVGKELLVSVDISGECADLLRNRFSSHSSIIVEELDLTDPAAAPGLREMNLDSAICFNVLEHILDDVSFLTSLRKVIRPGGMVVVVVPAHPFLYGTLDKAAGHHRRYTRKMTEEKLRSAGFKEFDVKYFNSIGAFGWFAASRVARQTKLSSRATEAEIKIFEKYVLPFSKAFDRLFMGSFGQSIAAVAEVPSEAT